MPKQLYDFIRAVPKNKIAGSDTQFCRKFLFQVKRVAIGVKVQVRDDLSPAQALKTLVHERAHTILLGGRLKTRELVECEAESAAYVVLSALGIDAGTYSFGYVAGWSKGDSKVIQAAGRNA